jgi:hypothetical protein
MSSGPQSVISDLKSDIYRIRKRILDDHDITLPNCEDYPLTSSNATLGVFEQLELTHKIFIMWEQNLKRFKKEKK